MTYQQTLKASYIGYITQAIVNNFVPLLFVVFQTTFQLTTVQLTGLITLNFGVQLTVDAVSALIVDQIGYRKMVVAAHGLCTVGLISLGILPNLLDNSFHGLLFAVVLNAVGGGIIEVIISPIVEAIPNDKKAASMSLLHSFYCWGYVAVVLFSTLFFMLVGVSNWWFLCFIWALVPLINMLLFTKVPIKQLVEETDQRLPLKKLFSKQFFWLLVIAMICAGASEQAMSQWASLFAETGLGVSKAVGDLLGPCVFAMLMGMSRLVLGKGILQLKLATILIGSSLLCISSYILAVFSPNAGGALIGCGLCGLAVGALWPTTFSLASQMLSTGGTAMFAFLALAGDLGCASGPALVGLISSASESGRLAGITDYFQDSLKVGLCFATLFPCLLIFSVLYLNRSKLPNKKSSKT